MKKKTAISMLFLINEYNEFCIVLQFLLLWDELAIKNYVKGISVMQNNIEISPF